MDLNMDLEQDLATGPGYGSGYGSVWGFPAGYGAICWGLSGTCLAGYGAISLGLSGGLSGASPLVTVRSAGTCLVLPRWLRCDQLGPVWDLVTIDIDSAWYTINID